MNVTTGCYMCGGRAVVSLDTSRQASVEVPEALWQCPLCGHKNKTGVVARIISVTRRDERQRDEDR